MQKSLGALGFAAIIGALALSGFQIEPVVLCLMAWSALWLGIWQASRLRITAGNEAQAKPTTSTASYWGKRLGLLLISLVIGVGAYTQYLVRKYELPEVYQWQAMAWVLGINRPTPTLVTIPAGSFDMGSTNGRTNEKPVHRVTIPKQFLMGESEVTFTEYDYAIWQMKQVGLTKPDYPKDQDWGRSQRPVINVSWSESQAYLNWLSQNNPQGLVCRLPSEAEWEYAARAGTTTPYYWGDDTKDIARKHANFSDTGGRDQWNNETAPVKQFEPNGFGLYDMSGNVWEWVQDRWNNSYLDNDQTAPEDGSAWESGSAASRVLRGGSWFNSSSLVRSAYRFGYGFGLSRLGFRVICSPIDH